MFMTVQIFAGRFRRYLGAKGLDVITAEDGSQAIQAASENPIGLTLTNVQMPGINGVDAFIEIKMVLPECAVVIMTGHAVESLIQKALSEGALICSSNPISIEQILVIADEYVTR